jgi:hypothetical protein
MITGVSHPICGSWDSTHHILPVRAVISRHNTLTLFNQLVCHNMARQFRDNWLPFCRSQWLRIVGLPIHWDRRFESCSRPFDICSPFCVVFWRRRRFAVDWSATWRIPRYVSIGFRNGSSIRRSKGSNLTSSSKIKSKYYLYIFCSRWVSSGHKHMPGR